MNEEVENERITVATNMDRYSGSFVQSLAQCILHADNQNLVKIKTAFPEYWNQYLYFNETNVAKYKYVGTNIDVPDDFEEWHITLLLDYGRIYIVNNEQEK